MAIEQTGKTWKALQAAGVVLLCGAAVAWAAGSFAIAVLVMLAGAAFYVAGRVGAWWHHG